MTASGNGLAPARPDATACGGRIRWPGRPARAGRGWHETSYGDPVDAALAWQEAGADWITWSTWTRRSAGAPTVRR